MIEISRVGMSGILFWAGRPGRLRRLADGNAHRYKHTNTQIHEHKHTNANTYKHTNTQTQKHKCTQIQTYQISDDPLLTQNFQRGSVKT